MPFRRLEADEGGDDDERHAVGERVLVNLVLEGAEDEQPKDRGEQLGGEERTGSATTRPSASSRHATIAQAITNMRPDIITTGESSALIWTQS